MANLLAKLMILPPKTQGQRDNHATGEPDMGLVTVH
jgi:hypothetical protein